MTDQHPITPPQEKVDQWGEEWHHSKISDTVDLDTYLATQAAQWGADQELEATLGLMATLNIRGVDYVRNARRPAKPPSLKEQALSELEEIMTELHDETGSAFTASAIRRALEALDD